MKSATCAYCGLTWDYGSGVIMQSTRFPSVFLHFARCRKMVWRVLVTDLGVDPNSALVRELTDNEGEPLNAVAANQLAPASLDLSTGVLDIHRVSEGESKATDRLDWAEGGSGESRETPSGVAGKTEIPTVAPEQESLWLHDLGTLSLHGRKGER